LQELTAGMATSAVIDMNHQLEYTAKKKRITTRGQMSPNKDGQGLAGAASQSTEAFPGS
jgi:hypothetical protein